MKKLLIATSNPWKIQMFKDMLKNVKNIEFLFLNDFKEKAPSPEENWKTPQENALIKAKYYSEFYKIPTLADDAGFEIDELNWEPWVMARRWWWILPDNTSDEDWLKFYLNKTKEIPWEYLHGSFPFARCLYISNWKYFFQSDKKIFFLSRIPRKIFKPGWPVSALRVYKDWRHEMDIPPDDPIWQETLKKEDLIKLLNNL